jgi:hypothetical protein
MVGIRIGATTCSDIICGTVLISTKGKSFSANPRSGSGGKRSFRLVGNRHFLELPEVGGVPRILFILVDSVRVELLRTTNDSFADAPFNSIKGAGLRARSRT